MAGFREMIRAIFGVKRDAAWEDQERARYEALGRLRAERRAKLVARYGSAGSASRVGSLRGSPYLGCGAPGPKNNFGMSSGVGF
jgi:hypothetical protein